MFRAGRIRVTRQAKQEGVMGSQERLGSSACPVRAMKKGGISTPTWTLRALIMICLVAAVRAPGSVLAAGARPGGGTERAVSSKENCEGPLSLRNEVSRYDLRAENGISVRLAIPMSASSKENAASIYGSEGNESRYGTLWKTARRSGAYRAALRALSVGVAFGEDPSNSVMRLMVGAMRPRIDAAAEVFFPSLRDAARQVANSSGKLPRVEPEAAFQKGLDQMVRAEGRGSGAERGAGPLDSFLAALGGSDRGAVTAEPGVLPSLMLEALALDAGAKWVDRVGRALDHSELSSDPAFKAALDGLREDVRISESAWKSAIVSTRRTPQFGEQALPGAWALGGFGAPTDPIDGPEWGLQKAASIATIQRALADSFNREIERDVRMAEAVFYGQMAKTSRAPGKSTGDFLAASRSPREWQDHYSCGVEMMSGVLGKENAADRLADAKPRNGAKPQDPAMSAPASADARVQRTAPRHSEDRVQTQQQASAAAPSAGAPQADPLASIAGANVEPRVLNVIGGGNLLETNLDAGQGCRPGTRVYVLGDSGTRIAEGIVREISGSKSTVEIQARYGSTQPKKGNVVRPAE
jgi:hypothetical protein